MEATIASDKDRFPQTVFCLDSKGANPGKMFSWLTQTLLPSRCLLCEVPLEGGVACRRCLEALPWWREAPLLKPWGRIYPCWHYRFPIREVIQRCKYGRQIALARFLGELMAERFFQEGAPRPEAIVPVPLHPRRERERGFNQSGEIAGVVARRLGVPLLEAVERVRDTPPQAGLSREARRHNLKGAFRVGRAVPRARIVLLDDVVTTGATLSELATALQRSGAAAIDAWVCAAA